MICSRYKNSPIVFGGINSSELYMWHCSCLITPHNGISSSGSLHLNVSCAIICIWILCTIISEGRINKRVLRTKKETNVDKSSEAVSTTSLYFLFGNHSILSNFAYFIFLRYTETAVVRNEPKSSFSLDRSKMWKSLSERPRGFNLWGTWNRQIFVFATDYIFHKLPFLHLIRIFRLNIGSLAVLSAQMWRI